MSTVDIREPYTNAAAVTPHATNPLPINPVRALYVGGAGTLAVRLARSGADVTFAAVTAGTLLPIEVDRVYASGTSAASIVALA